MYFFIAEPEGFDHVRSLVVLSFVTLDGVKKAYKSRQISSQLHRLLTLFHRVSAFLGANWAFSHLKLSVL